MIGPLNPWRWLILAGAVAGVLLYHFHAVGAAEKAGYAAGDKAGAARIQAQYDVFKGEMIARTTKLLTDAYLVSDGLRKSFADRTQELTREKTRIARQRDAALAELRTRPERPAVGSGGGADVPGDSAGGAASAGCTGAKLYRPDAAFLVREAARAELIRSSLLKCYADFDDARARLAEFTALRAPSAAASGDP